MRCVAKYRRLLSLRVKTRASMTGNCERSAGRNWRITKSLSILRSLGIYPGRRPERFLSECFRQQQSRRVDFTAVECIIFVWFPQSGINRPEGESMTYIICEPCVGTKDTACVDACPVDCIHPKKDEAEFEAATMLYIHPEECIDCGACEPACPVTAIFPEDNVPEQWQNYIPMNYEHFGITKK